MAATASDYAWWSEHFPGLDNAYCVSLVRGLSPAEVLVRLDGRAEQTCVGVDSLVDAVDDPHEAQKGRQLYGAAALGGWTLVIEPNGFLGVTEARAQAASRGTRWISHFRNINNVDQFVWAQDGVLLLAFAPLFPDTRRGARPDAVLDAMHRAGFAFGDEVPEADIRPGEAAFALAEHLTGVRLTPESLRYTAFTCGSTRTW